MWSLASSINSILEAVRNAEVQAHPDLQNSSLPLNKNPGDSRAQENWSNSALNDHVTESSFFHPLPHSRYHVSMGCRATVCVCVWGGVVSNFSFWGHENFILFLGSSSMHLKTSLLKPHTTYDKTHCIFVTSAIALFPYLRELVIIWL